MSDMDDDREETPDLYRNSTLGMLEPRGTTTKDDDEEMYDDEYGDELDYGDEDVSDDVKGRMTKTKIGEMDDDELSEDDEMDSDDMEDMDDHVDM
ncbi:E3 ubiquitin-protein ligase [Colletotrichum higginsianum]|nr:E3 ubiquitin-protein ligase [Colletotrichum higginsianum]